MSDLLLLSSAPVIGELLSTLLHHAGYTVHVAPHAARAFDLLAQHDIAAIICDLLPQHHAGSVCAPLRAHRIARNVPLVLLTPYHLPDASVVAEAHAVIVKPFPFARLLAALHTEHAPSSHHAPR